MRLAVLQWVKKFDPGLVVVVLLATLAAWPFITRPGLPTFTDIENHVYRTYEIMSNWGQGVWYSRWAPDFFFGYGYPVFNYYAPLTYYLGAAYGWFLGGPVAGTKFVLVVAGYLGSIGLYVFIRRRWGALAGVVGTAAYTFAPYIVYINPHWRGALPETFAVALGPWWLWALERTHRATSPGNLGLAAALLAALTLAHNLVSFLFIGLGLAWLGWLCFLDVPGASWFHYFGARLKKFVLISGGVIGLGFGLAAFMWLPALLERNAVALGNAFTLKPGAAAGLEFVSPSVLFAPAAYSDVADPLPGRGDVFKLGLAQWVLGLVGLAALVRPHPQRRAALFFALMTGGLVFLMLPVSKPVWETFFPLTYLQFPWRLLGPAAIGLGVSAGVATQPLEAVRRPWGGWMFGLIAVVACIGAAFPILDPLPWAEFGPVTPRHLFSMESNRVLGVGTTVQLEFLPVDVKTEPPPRAALVRADDGDWSAVDKVDRESLPPAAQVTVLRHQSAQDWLQTSAAQPFTLTLFTFYFPGWTAYIDQQPVPIHPSTPYGFITVLVPAGEHDVQMRFEDTWPRQLGWGISLAACLALIGLLVWQAAIPKSTMEAGAGLAWNSALPLMVVIALCAGLRYTLDQVSPWSAPLPETAVWSLPSPLPTQLEDNIALVAYDLPRLSAAPGAQVPFTLYWKATGRVPLDLSVFVHFIGPDGKVWGQSDKLTPAAYYPTGRWPLNRYFQDDHVAALRPDAPAGVYTLRAGLWNRDTGLRLHVLDAHGAATDEDSIVLTTSFSVQP